jgi:nucleoside-diphosphate-sugar epimerase
MEMARIVSDVIGQPWVGLEEGSYEAGEKVNGKPISFTVDSTHSRGLLDWEPEHSLEKGLEKTVEWYYREDPY